MNIYEKIQQIKMELAKCNLKKSGRNTFADYDYYELSDFMPKIIELCSIYKVCTVITFSETSAVLEAINAEEPKEMIVVNSPMKSLTIKGANELQALGGVETYQRRYLYMTLFDICESDMFDKKETEQEFLCADCKKPFESFEYNGQIYTAEQAYVLAMRRSDDGKPRCKQCRAALKNAENNENAENTESTEKGSK